MYIFCEGIYSLMEIEKGEITTYGPSLYVEIFLFVCFISLMTTILEQKNSHGGHQLQ